ncbi:MAG: helix-turn-helix transcriptional regulator [Xanthomonadaceae bacterium]|nr:helix-turn-helix transcriptional regulator [Xanthomonadaceae bacterium]
MIKKSSVLGSFIKTKRTELGLSQKMLGSLLDPQVTTQFISNIERGATPLPAVHIAKICSNLKIREEDLIFVMEKEYADKLNLIVGLPPGYSSGKTGLPEWWSNLAQLYLNASQETQENFIRTCEDLFPSFKTKP